MTVAEALTRAPEETESVGERIGRLLHPGDVILLHGDLGSGKTTLTQGIARGLGVRDYVQSPTFTLVAEHSGRTTDGGAIRLYHLDLYRLTDAGELDSFGYDQYLDPSDGVTVVEWPERAGDRLPDAYLLVTLNHVGPDERRLRIEAGPMTGPHAATVIELQRVLAASD